MDHEELVAHIAQLTENQRSLMEELAAIRARPSDPFSYYKTPDPIKNISQFSGNKRETLAWIQEVEETLELFNNNRDQPIYPQLIRAVKSKIIGEAKGILIAAGNPSSWSDIKETLLNSYGDKRDLTSHIQSLFYITQGKKTLSEYYNKIKQIDTAIKSTANNAEQFSGATKQINAFVELMSTTRYIDGLGESLSMIVRSHKPGSLEEAYNCAMQYSNAAYRQKLEKNSFKPAEKKFFNTQNEKPNSFNQPTTSKHLNNPGRYQQNSPSGKFKPQKFDDDVTMQTMRSKQHVNHHEGNKEQTTEFESDKETPYENDTSRLESEDDDYFEEDDLNFQLDQGEQPKT